MENDYLSSLGKLNGTNKTNSTYLDNMQLNVNKTLCDPYLLEMGKVTLNKNNLPTSKIQVTQGNTVINCPPSYLPASIRIYHGLSSNGSIEIPILFPESYSESLQANFIKESPVGSKLPIVAFSNTNPTSIPFSFICLSDYLPKGYSTLKSYIDAIKTMVYPKYNSTMVDSPWVIVTFADQSFTGICESINIEYDTSIFGNHELVKATVSCQFIIVE